MYSLDPDQFERSKQIEKWKNSNRVLSQEIVGQINAKLAVTNSYGMTISGMEDKTKPKSRKIFAGPPGQGKTELIYAAGKVMGVPVVRIVMTSYTSPTQTQDLKKTITEALRRKALSLLFFDEIEKAHPSVQKDLLDILDSGTFAVSEPTANGRGSVTRVINVKNSHVFMATNAGTSYIDSLALESEYDAKKMRQTMIEDGLSEYVIDRMDGIVPFFYLSIDEYRSVVIKKIRKIVEEFKLSNPKIKLKLNNLKGFVDQFVTQTFHAKMRAVSSASHPASCGPSVPSPYSTAPLPYAARASSTTWRTVAASSVAGPKL